MANGFEEPPFDPDDTTPTGVIRMVEINDDDEPALPAWRRAAGLLTLIAAALLTLATAVLILLPPPDDQAPAVPTLTPESVVVAATETLPPTIPPPTVAPDTPIDAVPTLSAEAISAVLSQPNVPVDTDAGSIRVVRNAYDPFTLIPDRPRNEVIEYVVEEGDTIFAIAERFGLKPESIAWSNDRNIIGNLRPGRPINIAPVDGVYYQVIGTDNIAQIAASYGVTDPYIVIDSEYNDLFGASPDTVLPSGTWLFIPGGIAEQITWSPPVQRESSSGNVSANGGDFVSFAVGEAGSCGRVQNVTGTGWARPIGNYGWSRGFTSWHTGVDLAADPGTPVFAANGGVVIFAGWNSYGYGNTIVLSHGPFSTVYGHLSSINVGCGQVVSAGQGIGGVGSSGNSSGPHLHFEIRYLDQPLDPVSIIGF